MVEDYGRTESLAGLSSWARQAPNELKREFRRLSQEAGQSFVEKARSRVHPIRGSRSSKGRRISGRRSSKGQGLTAARNSIKVLPDAIGMRATYGANIPARFGFEFGGGKHPRTRQFPEHRGRLGYFFYPTLREEAANVLTEYGEAVERLWPRPL